MTAFKFRTWTGPTIASLVETRLRDRGIRAEAGTEHVYGEVEAADQYRALDALNDAAGFPLVELKEIWRVLK